jgi:uncharacterized repeat protein (TIGR03803 family)
VVYAFRGSPDGAEPYAGSLLLDAGNIYGTTINGGESGNGTCVDGCGTVFKLNTKGTETVLYRFRQVPDGNFPVSGVIRDAEGNLYGTTHWGGASNYSCGAIFEITESGTETLLYSFAGGASDGCSPQSSLFRDSAGNLFGTTEWNPRWGDVFELTASGKETTIHSFANSPDGSYPVGGLIRDAAGNFYGTTQVGGTTGCTSNEGCGTVFKLDPTGQETVLYRFTGGEDGAFPHFGDLVRDATGNLYGMTF